MYSHSPVMRSSLIAVALLGAGTGSTQDALDEITVTADYRGRPISEVPANITVLDAAKISETAIQHFEELIGGLANLNWSGDGHRARYIQIRGVGELAQYQGAPNPSVGFVVDDIDFSGIGTIATLWDIDRIEVLRGPQGTRYGSNALAGLIYMQSTAPTDEFEGRLQLTAGGDDALGGGIAFGGPINERDAGYRLSAHHYGSDGFRSNPYLGRDDTNARDETSLRARVDWVAGDNWEFRLTGMYADVDDGYDAFAIDNSLTVLSNRPGKDTQRSTGVSLNIDWNGSKHVRITSVSSIAESDIDFSFDADWGNDDAWAPVLYDYVSSNDRQRMTLNRELRFLSTEDSRLFGGTTDWLVGLYLNKLDEDLATVNRGEYFDPGSDFADSLDERLESKFEALSGAVFGRLEFTVGDAGRLAIGTRVERREVEYTDSSGLDVEPGENMIGGALSYTHTFSADATGFATLSRGYKGGGFNLGFVPAGRREYDSESMWNLEVGFRTALADDSLFVNGSVFYNLRDDQQVETSFQIDPNDPASFVFYTDNAAQGETWGIEADVRWFATEQLEFYASLGLLRATFDEFVTPQVDASGRDQAHAPHYTYSVGTVWRHPSGWFARADVTGKDDFYFDVSHDQVSEPYSVTNLRLGYATERWTAQAWLRNAFDERYAVRGFYFGNEPPLFPDTLYIRQGDPRQLGVTID
ncbi:MAG: TonB-dependent receptor plug domain-containing protein, partial [Gammaproteobacteria bacterium]|nr:TonB-dependent receptor plug domain-containing protein [Gammaproteobacteria bacterium]